MSKSNLKKEELELLCEKLAFKVEKVKNLTKELSKYVNESQKTLSKKINQTIKEIRKVQNDK